MKACIFHDLNSGQKDKKIFDLVEHAYSQGDRVLIYAPSEARAAFIDRFLWTLRQESFIPHKIFLKNEDNAAEPVGIVTLEINPIKAKTLIADGRCSIAFASGFETIHEFVDRSTAETHEASRKRYSGYRDLGIPPQYLKE